MYSLLIVVGKEKKLIIAITTFTILKEILVLASFGVQKEIKQVIKFEEMRVENAFFWVRVQISGFKGLD